MVFSLTPTTGGNLPLPFSFSKHLAVVSQQHRPRLKILSRNCERSSLIWSPSPVSRGLLSSPSSRSWCAGDLKEKVRQARTSPSSKPDSPCRVHTKHRESP